MNVRSKPSMNAAILATKDEDTIISVTAVKNDWLCLTDGTYILYGKSKFASELNP